MDRARLEHRERPVARLPRELAGVERVALPRADPAVARERDGDRLVGHAFASARRARPPRSACAACRRSASRPPRSRSTISSASALRSPSTFASPLRSALSALSSLSILIASSRASWRRRISRMSSAWTSVSPNAAISSAFGSSALRMTLITLSMESSAIMRPSRMWMRRSTSPSRCVVRRVTVSKRKAIHSSRICASPSSAAARRGRASRG